MFLLGVALIIGWIFCFFYYGDVIPQNWSIGIMIAGIFSMGWGLLTSKR